MAVKVVFQDPDDPPNPGPERFYSGGLEKMVCTDMGNKPLSEVLPGWKIKRQGEPWLTVLSVEDLGS